MTSTALWAGWGLSAVNLKLLAHIEGTAMTLARGEVTMMMPLCYLDEVLFVGCV